MNFNLPKQAYLHRFIPKSKFFDKAVIDTKLKKEFTDQIQKIIWEYKLAPSTIGVTGTEKVEEIQIFVINLKELIIPKNVLKIIDKTIPYPILYIFRYEQHYAYGINLKDDNLKRYFFSEWDEIKEFDFSGINLEYIYQGLVSCFLSTRQKGQDFATMVQVDRQREILQSEIQILHNKIKNEKQFNRKVELNKTILEKKKILESIL